MTSSPLHDLPAFQEALGKWFRHFARDLPWRRTEDPYAIVVSEFMLQQTQVKTVIPYYQRWLAAFPDFATLAAASEERVLSLWQGLGYYSRARSLHRLAQAVAALDEFPRDPAAIRALPGIGPYTAGAICAFAFDQPVPAVDGNIARVLARLFHVTDPVDSTAGLARIWELATAILPVGPGGGREQVGAIMELGAVVCLARKPLCLLCPVQEHCAGRAELGMDGVSKLPVKKPRSTPEIRDQHAILAHDTSGRVLLQQAAGPLWEGMWHLPLLAAKPEGGIAQHGHRFGITRYRVDLEVFTTNTDLSLEEWASRCIPFRLKESESSESPGTPQRLAWFPLEEVADLPIPAPHRRALGRLIKYITP